LYPPVNGAVTVAFSDCGSGVADSQIEHVLEPFHTTRRGGTGLGLSIVKHILELHGGNIVLRNNEPPPGLTVECILPVARQERAES
jgi:signal transduction histidine kinase